VQAAADTHTPLSSKGRGLSLLELVLGGAIVIGHNVFHLLPNEVPILVVLGLVSIRLREGSWPAIGLGRPKSWWRTIAIAFAAAILVLAADQFITEPLARAIGLHANAGAAANALGDMKGHAWNALKGLVIVWTFAAFGEEIGYRRYLLGRAADVGNRSPFAYWIGLLVVSVPFGFGHYYQGPAGVFTSACDGLMIGATYLLSRRNLWVAVLTHGLIDTIGIALLFFGLAD
jgi:membrane protease YdiL (CAAX protease family)